MFDIFGWFSALSYHLRSKISRPIKVPNVAPTSLNHSDSDPVTGRQYVNVIFCTSYFVWKDDITLEHGEALISIYQMTELAMHLASLDPRLLYQLHLAMILFNELQSIILEVDKVV